MVPNVVGFICLYRNICDTLKFEILYFLHGEKWIVKVEESDRSSSYLDGSSVIFSI